MDLGLTGRPAIIAASSRGLGRACADALANEGVSLVINGRDQNALSSAAAEISRDSGVDVVAVAGDIAEETTRLRSHLDQFAALKTLEDEIGKRMDFILQEMNREVTTILSKTSGLNELGKGIGQAAIEIKVEIEKLREQVQNIE